MRRRATMSSTRLRRGARCPLRLLAAAALFNARKSTGRAVYLANACLDVSHEPDIRPSYGHALCRHRCKMHVPFASVDHPSSRSDRWVTPPACDVRGGKSQGGGHGAARPSQSRLGWLEHWVCGALTRPLLR